MPPPCSIRGGEGGGGGGIGGGDGSGGGGGGGGGSGWSSHLHSSSSSCAWVFDSPGLTCICPPWGRGAFLGCSPSLQPARCDTGVCTSVESASLQHTVTLGLDEEGRIPHRVAPQMLLLNAGLVCNIQQLSSPLHAPPIPLPLSPARAPLQGLCRGLLGEVEELPVGELHRLLPDAESRGYLDGEYLIRWVRVWGVQVVSVWGVQVGGH